MEQDGRDKRLIQLELAFEAGGIVAQILSNLAIAVISEAILMRISVE